MGKLREFLKKHSLALGFTLGSLSAGTLTGLYALHLTVKRLENVLDPTVTTLRKQAQYIYVENLGFDEQPDKSPWEDRKWEAKSTIPYWSQWIEKRTKGLSWRLLEIISTSDDEQEKLRTVKILKSQKNLRDSDFQHLAQLCDSKTAAFLAREPNIDTRFFLTPPKRKECNDRNCMLDRFHDLFVELKKKSNHWCLRYFVSKMFRHANWFRELEYFVFEFVTSPLEINNENAVKMCVETLLHHVMIQDNIHAMVEARGLEVLLDACRLEPDSLDLKLMAVKILMRVSADPRYLRDVHVTGWMRMLVQWSYECDQRLSAPAASALANLDRSTDCGGCCYKREVCILHPLHRESIVPDVDVIIVHGLLGSVHSTWRQRIWDVPINLGLGGIVHGNIDGESPVGTCSLTTTLPLFESGDSDDQRFDDEYELVLADIPESESEPVNTDVYSIPWSDQPTNSSRECVHVSQCWPKDWLPEDYARIKILGVDYSTRITDWTNWCPFRHSEEKAKLSERSKAIMEQLLNCGVGQRPIVWIGHSMGGLIIKHILTHALEENTIEHERLIKNSKHVFFLGTPHLGSPVASIRKYLVPFLPSVETRELELNSPELLVLHNKFCDLVNRLGTKVVTFLETKGTKLSVPPLEWELSCVAPMPGDSGTGVIYNIPVGHMDIAKLSTRMSFIYFRILNGIKQAAGPNFDDQGFLPLNRDLKEVTVSEKIIKVETKQTVLSENVDQDENGQIEESRKPSTPRNTANQGGEKSSLTQENQGISDTISENCCGTIVNVVQENTADASSEEVNGNPSTTEENSIPENDTSHGQSDESGISDVQECGKIMEDLVKETELKNLIKVNKPHDVDSQPTGDVQSKI